MRENDMRVGARRMRTSQGQEGQGGNTAGKGSGPHVTHKSKDRDVLYKGQIWVPPNPRLKLDITKRETETHTCPLA